VSMHHQPARRASSNQQQQQQQKSSINSSKLQTPISVYRLLSHEKFLLHREQ
jgi:hypothetical protein